MIGSRLTARGLVIGLLCASALALANTGAPISRLGVTVSAPSAISLPSTQPAPLFQDNRDASGVYGSYIGDVNDDALTSIARDSSGNYYFGGYTGDGTGDSRGLVGILDPNQNVICVSAFSLVDPSAPTTHIYNHTRVNGIALGRNGNFFAVGTAHDTTSTPGFCDGTAAAGDCDGWVSAFSGADCSVTNTGIVGGPLYDSFNGVSSYIDANDSTLDRVFIAGNLNFANPAVDTFSVGLLDPNKADFDDVNVTCGGSAPYFCAYAFSSSPGHFINTESWAVSNTSNRDAFHGGYLQLDNTPVNQKLFLVHVDPSGNVVPQGAQYFRDDGPNRFYGVRVAADGNVGLAANLNNSDGGNALYLKIANDFTSFVWAIRFGGTTAGTGIDSDANNNAYTIGNTADGHAFLQKIDNTGNPLDGGKIAGSNTETGAGIAVYTAGDGTVTATTVGQTSSPDFPVSNGSTLSGPSDGFIFEVGNFM